MRYLLQAIRPTAAGHIRAQRAAFTPDGVESYTVPCLSIGPLLLPADTSPFDAEICAHVAWMTAQQMQGRLLSCAQSARAIDLPDAPDADAAAQEIWRNRYGNPKQDGMIYILIPEQLDRTLVLAGWNLYPAMKSEAVEAKAAAFTEAAKADEKAVAKAKKSYLDCVEKALRDPQIMQYLFRADVPPGFIADAFDRSDYVQQSRAKIGGL